MARTTVLALALLPSIAWAAPAKPITPPKSSCYTPEEFQERYQKAAPFVQAIGDNGRPWLIIMTPDGLLVTEINTQTKKICVLRTLNPFQIYLPKPNPHEREA
jgi:hypothetical protein